MGGGKIFDRFKSPMTEDFLHYVWKYRLYRMQELRTTSGDSLTVVYPGIHNLHAGPDFRDARIRIGENTWAGQVEIHLRSSDWHRHRHTHDGRYHNVILHVVYDDDLPVHLINPGDLPVLHIRDFIAEEQWEKYLRWRESGDDLPCESGLSEIDSLTWTNWKDRLMAERVEFKARQMIAMVEEMKGDWDGAFFRLLARTMGFRVNAEPFEQLSVMLPPALLMRLRNRPDQVEAMLLGCAGLLPEESDEEYPSHLIREFRFFKTKFGLDSMPGSVWNTGRIRPANHPCLRIAQYASMVAREGGVFRRLLEMRAGEPVERLFDVEVSEYWRRNYRFGDLGGGREMRVRGSGKPGAEALNLIVINVAVISVAAYGIVRSDSEMLDNALKMLEFCKAERDSGSQRWEKRGVVVAHAGDSQALLHLTGSYCRKKRCLDCMIGTKLMQKQVC